MMFNLVYVFNKTLISRRMNLSYFVILMLLLFVPEKKVSRFFFSRLYHEIFLKKFATFMLYIRVYISFKAIFLIVNYHVILIKFCQKISDYIFFDVTILSFLQQVEKVNLQLVSH